MKVSAPFQRHAIVRRRRSPQAVTRDARRCKNPFFENYTKNTGNAWNVQL